MVMKKIILGLAIAILGTTTLNAQYWDKQFTSNLLMLDEYIKRNEKGISFDNTNTYIGTPYNNPDYLNGNVYKSDKLLATNVALRYNCIADEMEIKENLDAPSNSARVLTKSEDVYAKIANNIFVFVPYQGGIENGGYFEVLFEGNQIQLYKKHIKKFTAARKATNTLTSGSKAKFEDRPEYYIVTRTGKFYLLPDSDKRKLKVFGINKDLIKDYMTTNSLDLSQEADLIKVIMFYDSAESVN